MAGGGKKLNDEVGKFVVTLPGDDWAREPFVRLSDAVFDIIADCGLKIGDTIAVGMCDNWDFSDVMPTLEQLSEHAGEGDYRMYWLENITPAMSRSFSDHMLNALHEWLEAHGQTPGFYAVQRKRNIKISRAVMERYYRDDGGYDEDEIKEMMGDDPVST